MPSSRNKLKIAIRFGAQKKTRSNVLRCQLCYYSVIRIVADCLKLPCLVYLLIPLSRKRWKLYKILETDFQPPQF